MFQLIKFSTPSREERCEMSFSESTRRYWKGRGGGRTAMPRVAEQLEALGDWTSGARARHAARLARLSLWRGVGCAAPSPSSSACFRGSVPLRLLAGRHAPCTRSQARWMGCLPSAARHGAARPSGCGITVSSFSEPCCLPLRCVAPLDGGEPRPRPRQGRQGFVLAGLAEDDQLWSSPQW